MVFTLRIGGIFHVKSRVFLRFDLSVLRRLFAIASNRGERERSGPYRQIRGLLCEIMDWILLDSSGLVITDNYNNNDIYAIM